MMDLDMGMGRPPPPERPGHEVEEKDLFTWILKVIFYLNDICPNLFHISEVHNFSEATPEAVEKYARACWRSRDPRDVDKGILNERSFLAKDLGYTRDDLGLPLLREEMLNAFQQEFVNQGAYLDTFTEFINTCAAGWRPSDYLAPYTSLVQSSGSGKSRLIKEFAQRSYVVHCCLRPLESSGIPARSWIADELLIPGTSFNGYLLYASFVYACIEELACFVSSKTIGDEDISESVWYEQQIIETGYPHLVSGVHFWTKIHERMSFMQAEVKGKVDIQGKGSQFLLTLQRMIVDACKRLVRNFKDAGIPTKGRAVITVAMDEASYLLVKCGDTTLFNMYRAMISYILPGSGFFTVLVDTTSCISNLMPSKVADSSFRHMISTNNKLLPPFYMVDTFNCLAPEGKLWNQEYDVGEEELMSTLYKHFQKGRPLFASYLQSSKRVSLQDVVRLAMVKLIGGSSINISTEISAQAQVALLCVRAGLFVKPQSELASSLVAHHLGMCMAISSDRQSVFTSYPSEPVVAEAACRIMNRMKKLDLSGMVGSLLPFVCEGIVEGGMGGELVARLLLLLAWDDACEQNACEPRFPIYDGRDILYTRPMRVGLFLNSLIDRSQLENALGGQIAKEEQEKFMNGRIFFTHFTLATYTIKRHHLINFYEDGAAIMCNRGPQGFDLIIPVWLSNGIMSYIFVQVNNYNGEDEKYKWASLTITPQLAGLEDVNVEVDYPYLVLYLQLGYDKGKVYNLKYEKHDSAIKAAIPPAKRKGLGEPIDASQMIVGVFSLRPNVYPFLRQDKAITPKLQDASPNSKQLSSLLATWTDPLCFVEADDSIILGATEIKEAKKRFVTETCPWMYERR